ncbi:hypothetical protein KBA27_05760 [bacterium]|nr:hypothetical protein [bacterium]
MIKIFIATFFIFEIIIAMAIIIKLYKFDKKVISLEKEVKSQREVLKALFLKLRETLVKANEKVLSVEKIARKKEREFRFGLIKQLIVFLGIFLLKDKYKKKILFLNIMIDVFMEVKNELQTA